MTTGDSKKFYYSVCPFSGCHQHCGLKVWVNEGKIYKVESADYPGEKGWRSICLKGLASLRWQYHPDRLKYPLKRVGERGSRKFQRISWDEALDTIATKLLEIKEKYGARSVKIIPGGSSTVGVLSGRLMGQRFANVWGAGGEFEGGGWSVDAGLTSASLMVFGDPAQGHDCRDYKNSRLLILWGWNPAETSFRDMKFILDAKDAGVKLVVINPLYDATAAKADVWIPVKIGSDAALALSMMNEIIARKLYDSDYIAKYTVGPYLVRLDNGLFLTEADILPGGKANKYLVWDQEENSALSLDSPIKKPAILGRFKLNGVLCATAFQLLCDRAAEYPVEKGAALTGVDARVITNLAVEYATSKPAAIKMSYALSYYFHGDMSCRAVMTLAAITGNVGVSGGGASVSLDDYPVVANQRAITSPRGAPMTKTIPGSINSIVGWQMIKEGKHYPVKALLIFNQNTLQTQGNAQAYIDILKEMELIVVSEIFMSWTASFADIVLPEAITYERSDIDIWKTYITRLQKAVEPYGESRPAFDIWSDLARRVGLGEYFTQTPEDMIKILLSSEHPSLQGTTLERLDREGMVRASVPQSPRVSFADKKFPTPSGKIQFYLEELAGLGEALPSHLELLESPRTSPLAKKYPLTLFSRKHRNLMNSVCANIDWLQEIEPEPVLYMNPGDASGRGIGGGDLVKVFNDRGLAVLKAKLTEMVPPGAVNIDHGWWPEHFVDGHYNLLLHHVTDQSVRTPALETERVIKEPRASTHVLLFDILVEVEKVK